MSPWSFSRSIQGRSVPFVHELHEQFLEELEHGVNLVRLGDLDIHGAHASTWTLGPAWVTRQAVWSR